MSLARGFKYARGLTPIGAAYLAIDLGLELTTGYGLDDRILYEGAKLARKLHDAMNDEE